MLAERFIEVAEAFGITYVEEAEAEVLPAVRRLLAAGTAAEHGGARG